HQGRNETAEAIINQHDLTETERTLLMGMRASWQQDGVRGEQLLSRAASQLVGINRCWAHLELSRLFLEQGKDDLSDHHSSRARSYTYEDRQDRQWLSIIVELTEASADIERGADQRSQQTLTRLVADCSDIYLKGLAFYLLGCVGRFH